MNPDLAITIAFVFEVLLFALAGAIYAVHEARSGVVTPFEPARRRRETAAPVGREGHSKA